MSKKKMSERTVVDGQGCQTFLCFFQVGSAMVPPAMESMILD